MTGFFVVLGIALWVILAFWPAVMAKKKGYSFILFLLMAWLISWLFTLIIVLFLRDKNETEQSRADDRGVDAVLDKEEGL
jgi:MFS superfamily sulfate permease-like transporter